MSIEGRARCRPRGGEGIDTDRVKWNLSDAALYEEAVRTSGRRHCGKWPPWPWPHWPAHRTLAETINSSFGNPPVRRTLRGARFNQPMD